MFTASSRRQAAPLFINLTGSSHKLMVPPVCTVEATAQLTHTTLLTTSSQAVKSAVITALAAMYSHLNVANVIHRENLIDRNQQNLIQPKI